MIDSEILTRRVAELRTRYGLQDSDDHLVTTIHLMNRHRLDLATAQDQTPHGQGDSGVGGWHYDRPTQTLHIYRAKLSSTPQGALIALGSLLEAVDCISKWLTDSTVTPKLNNVALRNLFSCLSEVRSSLCNVDLVLISVFDHDQLAGAEEFRRAMKMLAGSELNSLVGQRAGRLSLNADTCNLDNAVPTAFASYRVSGLPQGPVNLSSKAHLQVVYLKLSSLVQLYRRRGARLFEKNVRLYLGTKESRARLEHPLMDTLNDICSCKLEPSIFPFYHVGVTLIAGDLQRDSDDACLLQTPQVINGCQTINIADRFLKQLERESAKEKIERFDLIPVLAKIVVDASDDQIRDIANSNNRQNPIESWQLYCNEPVHIRIEEAFASQGVFYERQKGKFAAEVKSAEHMSRYYNSNKTRMTVEELAQLITLSRRQLQLAAKPSEVFARKQTHDEVFDATIPNFCYDAVWAFNALKAAKAALANYLRKDSHANEITQAIFKKPIVRQSMHYVALMHLYQRAESLSADYCSKLNRRGPQLLVAEAETLYRKVISRTKSWYLTESNDSTLEVPSKMLDVYLNSLCREVGLDTGGNMAFTGRRIKWENYLAVPVILRMF